MSDTERQRDKARLDRLLDAWDRELQNEPDVEILVLASRSLPALLERRSKLLGLDATPDEKQAAPVGSAVDRINANAERRLAAVPSKAGG